MILDQQIRLADKVLTSINLPAVNITVSGAQIESGPLVYEFTAVAGQTSKTERYTFGNADGTGPLLSTLQEAVDGYRQQIADKAAWEEHARIMAPQVV